MPVFTLKAKDMLAVRAIEAYIVACEDEGLQWQAEQVREALEEIEGWQRRNPDSMKLPEHKHVPVAEPCGRCDSSNPQGECSCLEPCGTAWCWHAENRMDQRSQLDQK